MLRRDLLAQRARIGPGRDVRQNSPQTWDSIAQHKNGRGDDFEDWEDAPEPRRRRLLQTGRRDYVFTDPQGQPLSQELLGTQVWKPTLVRAGINAKNEERGRYNVRDPFINLAIDTGEAPNWIAEVCGNSEQMIFKHYRHRIKNPA